MKVLIAGSGVMGLWSAYFLNKAGADVTILEKESGPSGASMGNAGMIVPSHFTPLAAPGVLGQSFKWLFRQDSPFSIKPRLNSDLVRWGLQFIRSSRQDIPEKREVLYKLNRQSGDLYKEVIEKEGLAIGYKPRGLAMYCKEEHVLQEEASLIPLAESLGQEARLMNKEEAQALDPGLQLDIAGAVFYPGDAFLAPHDLMTILVEKLKERGVIFRSQSPLDRIHVKNGKVVSFQSGEETLVADEYVLATGAWSSSWTKDLGFQLPLQAGKGYSFTLEAPEHLPEICSILVEARIAVTPMKQDLRFGGTMEIVGLDPRINQKKVNGIKNAIPNYFPQFGPQDFEDKDIWYGFRPCSPDGLPYLGRPGHISNLAIATGHAMMGLSLGPVTGKLIEEVIMKGKKVEERLKPERFG